MRLCRWDQVKDLEIAEITLAYPGGPDAVTGVPVTRTQGKLGAKVDVTWKKEVV